MAANNSELTRQYFERADQLFNSIYTGEKSAFGRWLDKKLRTDIELRFKLTLQSLQKNHPQSILDIGIGPGQYLQAYINLEIPDITVMDFSEAMIELARKRVGEVPETVKVSYHTEDFMAAEIERVYDVTIAMGVFDYVENPVKFLSKMKAISTQNVLVSFPAVNIIRTPIRKFRYFFKRCPVYFYTRKKIEDISMSCGFDSYQIVKFNRGARDYWVSFECQ